MTWEWVVDGILLRERRQASREKVGLVWWWRRGGQVGPQVLRTPWPVLVLSQLCTVVQKVVRPLSGAVFLCSLSFPSFTALSMFYRCLPFIPRFCHLPIFLYLFFLAFVSFRVLFPQ
jgi:hypothetical protein